MKLEIKNITIIDDFDEHYNSPIVVQCHVEIGSANTDGADIFLVDVCNRKWMDEQNKIGNFGLRDRVLILDSINEESIRIHLENKYLKRRYSSFDEFVQKAADILIWEYSS